MTSIRSTGRFSRTRGQSPHVLKVGAAESGAYGGTMTSNLSTVRFRRTSGQSPPVLNAGAAESAP
jgi:hypothetical protein